MINVAPIRAAARATPGDAIAMTKEQLEQLLDETEEGQDARRELRLRNSRTSADPA